MERLQKYIASTGLCSRRKAETLILEGKVKVNGVIVRQLGTTVSSKDIVLVNNKKINKEEKVYYLLNKPKEVLSSSSDDRNRKTVVDLLETDLRIFPVGRLDYNTTGILILTNDGEFSNILTHPSSQIPKTYRVTFSKDILDQEIAKLEKGVKIDNYLTKPAKAVRVTSCCIDLTIHEGKNRQVRKMAEAINHLVIGLDRIKYGFLTYGNLKRGQIRPLTKKEIEQFRRLKIN